MNKPTWPVWSPLRSSYSPRTLLGGMPYRDSASTNIAETFKRVREQQEAERQQRKGDES